MVEGHSGADFDRRRQHRRDVLQSRWRGTSSHDVYFHGLPGFAGDLDLPLAVSRAGWNVLTLHYRGSWGIPANTATLINSRTPTATPGIEGLILISASDDSAEALNRYKTPASKEALKQSKPTPCSEPLAGCVSQSLDLEALDWASSWSFAALSSRLTKLPVLMITANDPYATENDALAAEIISHGGPQPIRIHLNTDHAYTSQRTALVADVIGWLQKHTPIH